MALHRTVLVATAEAQDPVPVYPDNYKVLKVLVENDQVRVLDFKLRKGDTEDVHSHPRDQGRRSAPIGGPAGPVHAPGGLGDAEALELHKATPERSR